MNVPKQWVRSPSMMKLQLGELYMEWWNQLPNNCALKMFLPPRTLEEFDAVDAQIIHAFSLWLCAKYQGETHVTIDSTIQEQPG